MSTAHFFSSVSVALFNEATNEFTQHSLTIYSHSAEFIFRRLTTDGNGYGLPRNLQPGDHYKVEHFFMEQDGTTFPQGSGFLVNVLPGDMSKLTYFQESDGSLDKANDFFAGIVD